MESVDVSAGSVCMHAVCTSGEALIANAQNMHRDTQSANAVMREMVQLGIVSYVVPETSRDIFSSDVEIGDKLFMGLILIILMTFPADYASEGGVFKIKAPQISSTGV
jgi:hypothetical protein